MMPDEELFVALETVLAFSIIWWVKDEVRRQKIASQGCCKSGGVAPAVNASYATLLAV